eukprot:1350844-Amorphochlora_amoeboformis.AAC.1
MTEEDTEELLTIAVLEKKMLVKTKAVVFLIFDIPKQILGQNKALLSRRRRGLNSDRVQRHGLPRGGWNLTRVSLCVTFQRDKQGFSTFLSMTCDIDV